MRSPAGRILRNREDVRPMTLHGLDHARPWLRHTKTEPARRAGPLVGRWPLSSGCTLDGERRHRVDRRGQRVEPEGLKHRPRLGGTAERVAAEHGALDDALAIDRMLASQLFGRRHIARAIPQRPLGYAQARSDKPRVLSPLAFDLKLGSGKRSRRWLAGLSAASRANRRSARHHCPTAAQNALVRSCAAPCHDGLHALGPITKKDEHSTLPADVR
jgi:hypothetical protein